MKETCCPQYTIRLDASQFKPNKNQRHVLNRLRRYLDSDDGSEEGGASDGNAQHGKQQPTKQRRQKPSPMSVDENMTVYHRRQPDQDQGREDDGNGKKRNKTEGKQTGLTNGGHGSSNGISGSSSSSNSSGENGHVKSRKEKRKGGGKIEGQEAADAKQLAAWSDIVATATALAVSDKVKSGGVFAGLTLEQGWETDLLPKWSQVSDSGPQKYTKVSFHVYVVVQCWITESRDECSSFCPLRRWGWGRTHYRLPRSLDY